MSGKPRFISIKTKIMVSTLIPVVISFLLICSLIFASLFNSQDETVKADFRQISQKYAHDFERKISAASDYLVFVSSGLELSAAADDADRETARDTVLHTFNSFGAIDGSSVYFEPDMYDGKDSEYIGTEYGTERSGRICYYFYRDNGETVYLPEALADDIEFELPHYTEAKTANRPIITEPTVHEVEGREIPMFTLTYPIRDTGGAFIGAVTVDLFLEDIYTELQNEKIYETGYIIISNDSEQIIYSPRFEDIGKTRAEAGILYTQPSEENATVFLNSTSIISGADTLVAVTTVHIQQLDSRFYISVVAPTGEINAAGARLTASLIAFSLIIVVAIALLLYYLIGRISTPIKKLTESADKIAGGDTDKMSAFVLPESRISDEVYILSESIKKMLEQLDGMQKLKLEALELKYEKERAEAGTRAKSDFLAKMSHEIRTPMNAIMGMSEIILRKEIPQDVYEDTLMIKNASSNLLSIINDILDFSKIESGKLEIVETDYLLPSLINDLISIARIRLADSPVQLAVSVEPWIPSALRGDEVRVRQVLTNLLSNAIKYTREGAISLDVAGTTTDGVAALTVRIADSGIGIKEEDIDKLFGEFVQIDAEKNTGIEGTGLGLAISRNLCRAMGGDITVSSEYGKGSVFTVTLPQKVNDGEPYAEVKESGGKSVLMYETRPVYMESVARALRELGVDCRYVENIPELFDSIDKCSHMFISSFMYGSVGPALRNIDNPPILVLMADVTETLAPKDARILALPAHSLSVANILNDVHEDYGGISTSGASFTAPEVRVLIVDDVTANLKVCEGLLMQYEMQLTLCGGGAEALERVSEGGYDLVFMDHMMPGMDGIEVTKHIRAMDGDYFKSLPIVALTANAVSGMKEMFIQNGMNDYLAKPIETVKLNAILEQWIPKEKRHKKTERQEEESEFVNMLRENPQLSVKKALSVVGGSVKTYERIMRLSSRTLPENIARLESLLETDLTNYAIEVHGVKGVLNSMGAYRLGESAFELEMLSKAGDLSACKERHPALISGLTELSRSLEALLECVERPEKTKGDPQSLKNALDELREAVSYYDSARALDVLSAFDAYSFGQEADKVLADLMRAIERFEFEEAEDLINKLCDYQ